jgi:hypothetical protein
MNRTSEAVQPALKAENEKDILIFQAGTVLWLEIGRQRCIAQTRFSAKVPETPRKIAGLNAYKLTSELTVIKNNQKIQLPLGTCFSAYASQIIRNPSARH